MTSIGAALRGERLRRGLRLEQVAAETKISIHLLEAMEFDHFDLLPRGLLARSFLRQYAHTLGLNEDEIIASFSQQCDAFPDPFPEPFPEDSSWHLPHAPEVLWVLVAVFACTGAYALWQEKQPASLEILSGVKLRPETVSSSPIRALPIEERPSEVVQDSNVQSMRVGFRATEPVWLSIKSDGVLTYRGTLEGQQSKEFGAYGKMTVLVGNAGGLEVSLNGRPVGPIGGRGEVQFLLLTPKSAHIVRHGPDTSIE
jgi:transcriptional regulator with XRE-family HTH domain